MNKQIQNLQIHFSKKSTSNTLNSNNNCNNNYCKNIINKNVVNKNSKEKKNKSKVINKIELINNASYPKTNILKCKEKKNKQNNKI